MTRDGIGRRDSTVTSNAPAGLATAGAADGTTPSAWRPAGPHPAAVVLATADDTVQHVVQRCADRAGTSITVYRDLDRLQPHGSEIELLLLGADLAAAATAVRLPPAHQIIVMSADAPDFAAFCTAAALRATYLTGRQTDRAWLTGQLATAAAGTANRL